jgi:hypothetical protein
MKQIEENLIHSFRMAKSDIIQLQDSFLSLSRAQSGMLGMIIKMKRNEALLYHRIMELEGKTKALEHKPMPLSKKQPALMAPAKRTKKLFVAAKGSKKVHLSNCPFAQNIKPKNRLTFKSKIKPLNEGFKTCKCIK